MSSSVERKTVLLSDPSREEELAQDGKITFSINAHKYVTPPSTFSCSCCLSKYHCNCIFAIISFSVYVALNAPGMLIVSVV